MRVKVERNAYRAARLVLYDEAEALLDQHRPDVLQDVPVVGFVDLRLEPLLQVRLLEEARRDDAA